MSPPSPITQSESLEWTESFGEYPAPSYSLELILVGPQKITLDSSPDGQSHQFVVASATTTSWAVGGYAYQMWAVTVGSDRHLVESGQIQVCQSFSSISTYDPRSEAEKQLEQVETAISRLLSGGAVQSYSIRGRNLSRYSLAELQKLRAELRTRVSREKGQGTVKVRFGSGLPPARTFY